MNTEILNLKRAFLLEAGLNVLHFESKEWLDTIAFWKDEIKFFDNLLKKTSPKDERKIDTKKMLEDLDGIHSNLFKSMHEDIIAHEKQLSQLEKGAKGIADAAYRERHRELSARMDDFKSNFFIFKKIVFQYVKDSEL
ncbi:hypothetical protein L1I30_06905 [Gillisia sp. M10.2A]|uniref:Uncharacterized protein n=1 Tax=Gillisia lutea TaxID=2909668 RepID=A0ABS9EIT9_9FLAO|nr:hypothetical protein [Gillisia lutea]MCF4101388.1 hypothetical protein [Gillisia lutea]